VPQIKSCVRVSRRMGRRYPPHASRRIAAQRRLSQQPSSRAAMLLSMRARARGAFWRNEPNRHFGRTKPSGELGVFGPSEAPTFGCRKRPRAQFHCFRPVLYNDFCNSHVSAALSAQDFQSNIRADVAVEPPSHSNGGSSIHRARRVAELSAAGADAVLRVPDVCSSIRTHGCL
jgi:hypothetical protein